MMRLLFTCRPWWRQRSSTNAVGGYSATIQTGGSCTALIGPGAAQTPNAVGGGTWNPSPIPAPVHRHFNSSLSAASDRRRGVGVECPLHHIYGHAHGHAEGVSMDPRGPGPHEMRPSSCVGGSADPAISDRSMMVEKRASPPAATRALKSTELASGSDYRGPSSRKTSPGAVEYLFESASNSDAGGVNSLN